MVESLSLSKIPAYRQFYSIYLNSDYNMSFIAWCDMQGYTDILYQEIENYIETGDVYNGDDNIDTLSRNRAITNGRSSMFQTQDPDSYFEIDWSSGYVKKIGKEEVKTALGLDSSMNAELIAFGNNTVTITDLVFNNLDDGQDSETKALHSSKYGNVANFITQEFDLDYVLNAIYIDPSDPQYQIAKEIFDKLFDYADQWLDESEIAELKRLKREHGDSSIEYNNYLKELILTKFHGLEEWDPNHKHVDRNAGGSLNADVDDNTVPEGSVPEYSMQNVLQNCGLSSAYYGNQKYTGSKHYENKTCEQSAANDAKDYVEAQLSNYINALIAELGDKCTEEMKGYMIKAKNMIVGSCIANYGESNCFFGSSGSGFDQTDSSVKGVMSVETFGGGWFEDWGAKAVVDIPKMINEFTRIFEGLCKNNGKTDSEVAAEKAAKEKEIAERKADYKSLYDMNMTNEARSAGIDSAYTVPQPKMADDIRNYAEEKILDKLKSHIRNKMAGKKIPESDLNAILDYATNQVLMNPSKWAEQESNGNYTIITSKLTDLFTTAVKDAVKQKGYNF